MGDLFGLWKEGGSAGAGFLPVNDSTLQLIKPDASVDNLPLKVGDLYGVRVRFVPDATPINAAYTLNLTQVDAKSLEPIGGNQFWFRTLAKGIVLPGDGGGGVGDNSPPVFVDCPESVPQYCEFPVTVRVDMANVPTPDNFLGNFTAVLEYDPAVMEYTGTSEILSGYTGLINATTPGRIVFNGADADGREGNVPVFTARFRALAPAGTEVETDLSLRALAAATTFRDLLPTATVHACRFTIDDNQLLGDVNGDGRINSTDAALILAYSVGNPIPASARSRIDAGIGNVDGNGVTNPRDALIILTYDVGLPVDYPLGTATVCPGTDAAAQHDADGEEQSPTVPVEVVPEREGEGYLLPVRVDMRGSGERLGSYLVEMTWDPARWTFAGIEGGSTPGFGESTANLEAVGKGMIRFAHAYAAGGADRVHVGSIRLLPVLPGEAGEPEPEVSLGDLTAAGTFQPLEGEVVRLSTAVGDPYGVKGVTFEAFPNPFGARTSIVVGLTEPTALQLTVLDPRGRQVAELARGTYPAGEHRFDWTSDGTGRLPAGVYIARLQLGKQLLTRRLILLR